MTAKPEHGATMTTSTTGGEKQAKLARYDLVPAAPLHTLAELYGKGAEKYEDRNWERGYEWSKSFAALNRHLWLFWQGVNVDDETGLSHLAAVAWHAFALMEWVNTHPEFDDRPSHTRLSEAVAKTLDEDDREPSPQRECCRAPHGNYLCTRNPRHPGEHIACGLHNREYARWPQ